MFSLAVKKARLFTRPVLSVRRYFDKTTDCGCGAFIILNDEGWILTAAHLFRAQDDARQHAREIAYYYGGADETAPARKRAVRRRRCKTFDLKANPKWITGHAFWWGRDGVRIEDVAFLPEADLVIGRLAPFEPEPGTAFPMLRIPSTADIGEGLCKLGYPFNRLDAAFNETDETVSLAREFPPLTPFPIEGIYTRTLPAGKSGDGKYDIAFLETSSPGLVGQSGGPIFDKDGTVWAIQSRTDILPMCASVREGRSGRKVRERHFLEVGVGVHGSVIAAFLADRRVRFSLSES